MGIYSQEEVGGRQERSEDGKLLRGNIDNLKRILVGQNRGIRYHLEGEQNEKIYSDIKGEGILFKLLSRTLITKLQRTRPKDVA